MRKTESGKTPSSLSFAEIRKRKKTGGFVAFSRAAAQCEHLQHIKNISLLGRDANSILLHFFRWSDRNTAQQTFM